jgi:hypothetical protein
VKRNQKSGIVSSSKPSSLNECLKVRVVLFGFIPNSHEGDFTKRKPGTISSPKPVSLEGEGDTFRFHTKCQVTANRMKAISQSENQEPLAHRSQLR